MTPTLQVSRSFGGDCDAAFRLDEQYPGAVMRDLFRCRRETVAAEPR
jgi:hypothetical protein